MRQTSRNYFVFCVKNKVARIVKISELLSESKLRIQAPPSKKFRKFYYPTYCPLSSIHSIIANGNMH